MCEMGNGARLRSSERKFAPFLEEAETKRNFDDVIK